QRDFGNAGDSFEQFHQPDFADEARDPDEQKVLAGEGIPDRQVRNLRRAAKAVNGSSPGEMQSHGGLRSRIEELRVPFPAELRKKFFAGDGAVGRAAGQPGEGTTRADHRFAEASGGFAAAKFEAIG